jgi:hypothetical protein
MYSTPPPHGTIEYLRTTCIYILLNFAKRRLLSDSLSELRTMATDAFSTITKNDWTEAADHVKKTGN